MGSCLKEDDDYFADSASVRIEKEVQKYQKLLLEPQEGWVMEYYPGGKNQTYGGFALTAKFSKDGKVQVQSVLSDDVSKYVVSYYSLKKDAGATLNFDTYNSLFHYFSDPDVTEGDGRSKGYLGDYEFIMKSSTDDMIIMEGKKHGSVIYMYALKESATNYLTKAHTQYAKYLAIPALKGTLSGTLGGKEVKGIRTSEQYFSLIQDNENIKLSFMFTDQGVKLYQPITINSYTLEDLSFDFSSLSFSSKDGKTNLTLDTDPLYLELNKLLGDYKFESSNITVEKVTISQDEKGIITMKGLPFNVVMTYNKTKGCLEIRSQLILNDPQVYLAPWNTIGGSLNWGSDQGLYVRWMGGQEMVFDLITNGSSVNANAWILWVPGPGEYKGFGVSRYMNVKLTKL